MAFTKESEFENALIKMLTESFGWEPKIQLREGLRHTIAYFDRLLSGHVQNAAQ